MPPVFNHAHQCRDKIRFPNKRAAKKHARMIERQIGARLRAYHCPHCDRYHLGNPIPSEFRRPEGECPAG